MFSVRWKVSTYFHRYELLQHIPMISIRLLCGTTVRICLQSPLKTIVMPPNGLADPRSHWNVRSAASNAQRSIIVTSSATMRCVILVSVAVLSCSLTLQVDSSVRMRGHFVLLWKVVPFGSRVAAMSLAAVARATLLCARTLLKMWHNMNVFSCPTTCIKRYHCSKALFHALHHCFDNSLLLVIKSVFCVSNVSLKFFHVMLNLVLDDAGSLIMVMKWIRLREAEVSTQCKAMSFNLFFEVEYHLIQNVFIWLIHCFPVHEVFTKNTLVPFPELQVLSSKYKLEHGPKVTFAASSITESTLLSLSTIPCAMQAAKYVSIITSPTFWRSLNEVGPAVLQCVGRRQSLGCVQQCQPCCHLCVYVKCWNTSGYTMCCMFGCRDLAPKKAVSVVAGGPLFSRYWAAPSSLNAITCSSSRWIASILTGGCFCWMGKLYVRQYASDAVM